MFAKIIANIRKYFRWYLLAILVFFSISLFFVILYEDTDGKMTVAFLNIGQGDATLVISPSGNKILIDGGPGRALLSELPRFMPFWQRHFDAIIIDNADSDHYEGIISLLKNYDADVVVESGVPGGSPEYAVLEKEIADKKIVKITARRGEIIDIGGGAYIEILFPDRDISGLATNNGSIIERLVFGKTSVLFEGDSPQAMEKYALSLDGDNGAGLKSVILHTGHHGSKTSSAPSYVAAVAPQYAIISAGAGNSYGHPNQETLDTLKSAGAEILATCSMDTVIFESDGEKMILRNKKNQPVVAGCI
jgi:competence protein ComEC